MDECFSHQGADILINSTDAVTNITHLKTISKVQIPVLIKLTSTCITATPCTLEVEKDTVISIQIPQLVMMLTIYLKGKAEPAYIPLTHKFVKQCDTHS